MAKIIEPGKVSIEVRQEWPIGKIVTCSACNCKWEIETNNDYIVKHAGGPKQYLAPCPTCEHKAKLN